MVYAGYVPAKLPPSKLSPQEAALQAVKSPEALEIIGKLIYNSAVQPKEDKYRSIKLSNPKIKAVIVDVPGALDALKAMGWQEEEGTEQLVIPAGVYMKMDHFKQVEAAKERLQKELKEQAREKLKSSTNLVGMVQA